MELLALADMQDQQQQQLSPSSTTSEGGNSGGHTPRQVDQCQTEGEMSKSGFNLVETSNTKGTNAPLVTVATSISTTTTTTHKLEKCETNEGSDNVEPTTHSTDGSPPTYSMSISSTREDNNSISTTPPEVPSVGAAVIKTTRRSPPHSRCENDENSLLVSIDSNNQHRR